jgi:hypothetical protein
VYSAKNVRVARSEEVVEERSMSAHDGCRIELLDGRSARNGCGWGL